MTKRCMYIITWPSLILSTFFGLYMITQKPLINLFKLDDCEVNICYCFNFYTAYCQKYIFK